MIKLTGGNVIIIQKMNATIDLFNIEYVEGSSSCPSISPEFPPLRAYQRTHRCPIGLVRFQEDKRNFQQLS